MICCTVSTSSIVSPSKQREGINISSKTACPSCKPILFSKSSLHATVVSRYLAARSSIERKLIDIAVFSLGKRPTIVSNTTRFSCFCFGSRFLLDFPKISCLFKRDIYKIRC
ncbi:hypothetical protein HanXRQr2_Chr14g0650751 [Helianthus annuus]|uniref:Uncharacterized protein n=1 Tax=Helianthus annuus TaxID=4232 RepID=A0A9K3EAM3_HELAN|nr:hypothetical protein HanXRQr2_Chr14g0650751 [Helianthus annuus]KAJ0840892.1 hypothetical protein HanPSC8_Chr14g0624191 [Helianthus annuus]